MLLLDLTLPSPAENLACDEALLDWAESGAGHPVLRFWQSPTHFVVLGYANRLNLETHAAACQARRIPILRRCSGGGTVLQGPGCFNYSLVLPIDPNSPLQSVSTTNRFVMNRHQLALTPLLPHPVAVSGSTDLTLQDRKFSGNSQRRKRRHLLFHGTFLLPDFNLDLLEELLPPPSRQPDYRQHRSHRAFLTCLQLTPQTLQTALRLAWNAHQPLIHPPLNTIAKLAASKYARPDWISRF